MVAIGEVDALSIDSDELFSVSFGKSGKSLFLVALVVVA